MFRVLQGNKVRCTEDKVILDTWSPDLILSVSRGPLGFRTLSHLLGFCLRGTKTGRTGTRYSGSPHQRLGKTHSKMSRQTTTDPRDHRGRLGRRSRLLRYLYRPDRNLDLQGKVNTVRVTTEVSSGHGRGVPLRRPKSILSVDREKGGDFSLVRDSGRL